jgi:hypothetical protein
VLKNERKIIGLGKFGPGIGKIPKGDPNKLVVSRIFNFMDHFEVLLISEMSWFNICNFRN